MHVKRTIETVLSQTYTNFEIIIVNDGSTDNSFAKVAQFNDTRIKILHQANLGVSAARNTGVKIAEGEFVAFIDADDEWKNDYLQTQIDLTRKYPQCDVFATNYIFEDVIGGLRNTILRKLPFEGTDGILSNYFEVASCSHPPLWTSSVMVRKSAITAVGGFPVAVCSGEDLLTWAKLATNYEIAYTKLVKSVFRQDGYRFFDKPKRLPSKNDIVGRELSILLHKNSTQVGLEQYVSHWHKMRSSCYLRLGKFKMSVKEAFIGLKYNPFNFKLYLYILLNFLPPFMRPYK